MSSEIEHEGKKYILKSQVETMIKDRVSKVAQRANEYQGQIETLRTELQGLQGKTASVDLLQEQLATLKSKYEASEGRFKRFKSVSKYGLTDPDLIDGVEWSYEKSQQGLSKKDRTSFSDWLEHTFENPDQAPIMLRPHITALKSQEAPSPDMQDKAQVQELSVSTEPIQPPQPAPNTNNGVQAVVNMNSNLLQRAIQDPELYEANREQIKTLWYSQHKRK